MVFSWVAYISYTYTHPLFLGFHFPFVFSDRKEIWSLKMNDSVLDLAATDDRTVFAALADGLVAVIQVRNIGQACWTI